MVGLLLFLLAVAALVAVVHTTSPRTGGGDRVGGQDFVAYWSAFDVAIDGGDPYDARALEMSQAPLGLRDIKETQRFWNPPWTLVVMAPVLALPFGLAVSTWFACSLVAGIAAAWLGWRLLRPGQPLPPLALGGSLVFLPFLDVLRLGQLSAVIALVALGALVALREGRDVVAGVLLALLAVKPQSLLVLLFVIGVHVLWRRRWRVVVSACASMGMLIVATWVLFPEAASAWDPFGGAPVHWRTPTIAGWIRIVLADAAGAPTWPLIVVPTVAIIATLAWIWSKRGQPATDDLVVVLCVSFLAAPFAWIFDATVLVALQVAVFGSALAGARAARWLALSLIAVNLMALWRPLGPVDHEDMVWMPMALLVVAVAGRGAGILRSHSGEPAVADGMAYQTGEHS